MLKNFQAYTAKVSQAYPAKFSFSIEDFVDGTESSDFFFSFLFF